MLRVGSLLVLSLALAACGGSSSGDSDPAPSTVVLSGQITFDWVPVVPGRGLSYTATVSRGPRAA